MMGPFQIGFRRMVPTKRVVIDKLFGGKMHGLRVRVDETTWRITYPYITKSCIGGPYMSDYALPCPPVGYDYEVCDYAQRRAFCGNTEIIFFADSKADEKRAFEMLTNYMLRGARVISSR